MDQDRAGSSSGKVS